MLNDLMNGYRSDRAGIMLEADPNRDALTSPTQQHQSESDHNSLGNLVTAVKQQNRTEAACYSS